VLLYHMARSNDRLLESADLLTRRRVNLPNTRNQEKMGAVAEKIKYSLSGDEGTSRENGISASFQQQYPLSPQHDDPNF
jgi:hypothetical protein